MASDTRLSRLDSRHGPFGQCQRGAFVTETHIGQREMFNQPTIFRLFLQERLFRAPVASFWAAA
jgi:hypothetical protein